jgi:hypothetical protein
MKMPMPPQSNHGFSLLGRKSLVLSHIPMFMPPHQAQLFLEVTLAGNAGENPTQIYLEDQAKTKSTDYVLVSDPLVLPTLGPKAAKRLQTFTGKLYRGWPFNNPNTEYMVHKLVQPPDLSKAPKPPDFVQILSAEIDGAKVEKLRQVHEISFPGTANDLGHKLNAGQDASGKMGGKKVRVQTRAELIYDPNHLTM